MSQPNDPLTLDAHWHLDCRIEAELPEDKVVGLRFIAGVVFALVALSATLYTCWLAYGIFTLSHQIDDWDVRLAENRVEARELMQMQGVYRTQADKIDRAFAVIKPRLFVTGFLNSLGRSLPVPMVLNAIESNDAGVVIRGTVKETSNGAAALLGNYVETLRKNQQISPHFAAIKVTNLERSRLADDRSIFEITFYLRSVP